MGTAHRVCANAVRPVRDSADAAGFTAAANCIGLVGGGEWNDGGSQLTPGSFLMISGSNLAADAKAAQLPAPTLLGGSCVTVGNMAIPLLQTSSGQIVAQLPANFRPGMYTAQVRSLALGQQSQSIVITVTQ